MQFNFITYMRDCATRLKAIGHTEQTPKFFRISSLAQLDELLSMISDIGYPALLIHDNMDGAIGDRSTSNNYLDIPNYTFYVVEHVSLNDHDAKQQVITNCKNIGLKILAKMKHDKLDLNQGLTFLQFDNIPYQTIGPIGDNCHGVMFTISVPNQAQITYNADDWTT